MNINFFVHIPFCLHFPNTPVKKPSQHKSLRKFNMVCSNWKWGMVHSDMGFTLLLVISLQREGRKVATCILQMKILNWAFLNGRKILTFKGKLECIQIIKQRTKQRRVDWRELDKWINSSRMKSTTFWVRWLKLCFLCFAWCLPNTKQSRLAALTHWNLSWKGAYASPESCGCENLSFLFLI